METKMLYVLACKLNENSCYLYGKIRKYESYTVRKV